METAIVVALIGAAGVILAAVLPILLGGKTNGRNGVPEPTAPNIYSERERMLRADERITRFLKNKTLTGAAEAAIASLCRGVQCSVDSWKKSSTWQQVSAVYAELIDRPKPTQGKQSMTTMTANELLVKLLQLKNKISFIDAYETMRGFRPHPWYTAVHSKEIIDQAILSETKVYEGLAIRLDALIVTQALPHEP